MVVLHAERRLGLPFEDLLKPQPRKTVAAKVTLEGDPAGALAGSVVVFTGALRMSRTEAATRAAQAGMCVRAGVTKQTTHLVVGDQDLSVLAGRDKSSKHRKAEEMRDAGHPIRIIGESAFRALVAGAGAARQGQRRGDASGQPHDLLPDCPGLILRQPQAARHGGGLGRVQPLAGHDDEVQQFLEPRETVLDVEKRMAQLGRVGAGVGHPEGRFRVVTSEGEAGPIRPARR